MYKGIFTDSDLLYRIDVVNSIDFYAMGFDMMRGETYARNALQWPQQERTDVLIVNVRLEDMSGFELAERIRAGRCRRSRSFFWRIRRTARMRRQLCGLARLTMF